MKRSNNEYFSNVKEPTNVSHSDFAVIKRAERAGRVEQAERAKQVRRAKYLKKFDISIKENKIKQ